MATDRIVVGIDDSPASTAAAVWAAGEAVMRDIELTIVHVLGAPEPCKGMDGAVTALPSDLTNAVVTQGVDVLDRTLDAVAKAIGRPPRITSQLCFGPVVPTLWEFTQQGAQMIALGQNSRGNAVRAGLSSVTSEMLQTARCPVAVVPHIAVSRLSAHRAPVVLGVDPAPACQLASLWRSMRRHGATRNWLLFALSRALMRPARPMLLALPRSARRSTR
jgi:nucleotide-binding universal stress UspA family protein